MKINAAQKIIFLQPEDKIICGNDLYNNIFGINEIWEKKKILEQKWCIFNADGYFINIIKWSLSM